ncbi:hypothetical protein NFI95_15830 [Acetobacteraceae bacterium KSS8]|uniref:Uncharacterized protein n=1 Tax=Endosaccharibacter trunci TaxID=2812733 RepID=A0ABT1WAK5_9PROT|nr:hypothetical protein [Acetobacteraceae bacterium KSS8]
MSTRSQTIARRQPGKPVFLYEESGGDGSVACPLAVFMAVLAAVHDDGEPGRVISAELPDQQAVDAILAWPAGLEQLIQVDRSYANLQNPAREPVARACFVALAPVLRMWRIGLGASLATSPALAWLDRSDFPALLEYACRRDRAARAIIADRAIKSGGDVVSIPTPGRHAN